jgi:16S rRNA A1518/A1519 N6-dimethyltransferase RsmA/KsgA/DIM1 with predicted DNA glycosylase/AP lyase activity
MNLAHRRLCRSAYWRKTVETYILPWVLDGLDLGTNVLEVGSGPGVTTDLLRGRVECLTCVEIDRAFADSFSRRMSGRNVTVVRQDATAFADATFDGAVSFTMLSSCPYRCRYSTWIVVVSGRSAEESPIIRLTFSVSTRKASVFTSQ